MDITDIILDIRLASVVLGILLPYLLYRYSTKNHSYWKVRGIPFVKPYPFIGSLSENFRKNLEDLDIERHEKLGKMYGFYEATKPMIVIAEPELLRDILVKDFQYFPNRRAFNLGDPVADKMITVVQGDDWKRIRTIVSPTFSTGKIKRVMSIFQDCAKSLIKNFKTAVVNDKPIDVLSIYGAFTMDVIASSAFSTKIDSHNDPENYFVKKAKAVFTRGMSLKFVMFLLFPGLLKKLKISIVTTETLEFFKKVTLEIIEKRKRTGQTKNDFLQLLMDSANEVAKENKWEEKSEDVIANYGDDSVNHPVFKNASSKNLSIDELVAQCIIFFLAGYHTTATTLGITTYFLALNQDVQETLYKEIKNVLAETNGELKYESMQKMKYLDNIISESLRLYPPTIRLERAAEADYKLGDTGITIPKGMLVSIPVFAMHRDPKHFPAPERFNPDRFSPEERETQIPYSYLPFGAGPRNCVGMRFALVELKVCLINVFSTFRVRKCPESKLEIGKGRGILQPKPIILRLEPRENCPLKA